VRVRDVDLDTGVVHVVRKFAELQNGGRGFGQAEVRCRFPHSGLALSAGSGGARAPNRVPPERSEGPDLQRAEGGGVAAKQLPSISALARMRGRGRTPAGLPVSTICATQATRWRPRRGASTRELMHRMGHASMRAALIYQHATSKRDQETAAAIDARIGTRR
jgi:hypothetical protein